MDICDQINQRASDNHNRMNSTPETDANIYPIKCGENILVRADFARKLETERNDLRQEVSILKAQLNTLKTIT